jgi:hypothetical protein
MIQNPAMIPNETEQKRQVAKVKLLETFSLGKNTGKNAGAEITVFGKDGKPQLGTIKIGSGSFEWWGKKAKKNRLHLNWYEFATVMEEEQERRRKK